MLLTLNDAQKIDKTIDEDDIFALELSIINYTNNHFHLLRYRPNIMRIVDNRIYIDGSNLFQYGDTIEISGVQYLDGFYYVDEVGDDWISLNTDINLPFEFIGTGSVFKINFPRDVKAGAKKILKYQVKANEKVGIKSESISRYSVTYDTADAESINGLPAYLYDFLAPYKKMRWG